MKKGMNLKRGLFQLHRFPLCKLPHFVRILDPILLPFDYSRKHVFSSQESMALYSVKKDHSYGLRLKEREGNREKWEHEEVDPT